jgi:hypothetical protein
MFGIRPSVKPEMDQHASDITPSPPAPSHHPPQVTTRPKSPPAPSHHPPQSCDLCYPFIRDPLPIQDIAINQWQDFVQPVLDEHDRAGRLHARGQTVWTRERCSRVTESRNIVVTVVTAAVQTYVLVQLHSQVYHCASHN